MSPWRTLRELGVNVPVEFALFPSIVLDRISTDWVLGPGNNLLIHYIMQESDCAADPSFDLKGVPEPMTEGLKPTVRSRPKLIFPKG